MNKKIMFTATTLLLLFIYYPSYSSRMTYIEDINYAQTRSVITGITAQELGENAAITLGFKGSSSHPYQHAYLVFEIPGNRDDGQPLILLNGVHLGFAGDGWYDPQAYVGAVSGGAGSSYIFEDPSSSVIQKFFRGYIYESVNRNGFNIQTGQIIPVGPDYTKYRTFLIPKENALRMLDKVQNDKSRGVSFSLKGWGWLDSWCCFGKSFNCCTYAARILRAAGINIPEQNALQKDHNYLQRMIDLYQDREGFQSINPPAAEELLNTYLNQDRGDVQSGTMPGEDELSNI